MTEPADIVRALRTRAEDAGRNVILYRVVNEDDALPTVIFAAHEEGRERDPQAHGLVHRLLDITVLLVAEAVDDDHAIEALELADELASDLVVVEPDVPDTLGGLVNSLEVIEVQTDTRTSSTDVMICQLLIRAAYNGA